MSANLDAMVNQNGQNKVIVMLILTNWQLKNVRRRKYEAKQRTALPHTMNALLFVDICAQVLHIVLY